MGVQELEKAITDSTFKKFVFEWEERELAGAGEGCGIKERLFLMVIFLLIILLILKDIKSYKKVKRVICQINPDLAIINILLDFHFFSCILKIRIMVKTHPLSHNQRKSSFWTGMYSEEGLKNILKLSTVKNYKSMQMVKLNINWQKDVWWKIEFFSITHLVSILSGMRR